MGRDATPRESDRVIQPVLPIPAASSKASGKAKGAGVIVALIAMLGVWEGSKPKPYLDHIGIPTACRGITGPEVTRRYNAGERFTTAECDAMETAYILTMQDRMAGCIKEPMSDGEWLAYSHFAFNVGTAGFCKSSLVKRLNAGDHAGACRQMAKWTWAGGRNCRDPANRCTGLPKRRDAEVKVCLEAL